MVFLRFYIVFLRGQVYLPAIGQSIPAHEGFRLFAAQNPVATGGGRKGLPRSFLNRFTRVVLSQLSPADLRHICPLFQALEAISQRFWMENM